MQSSLLPKVATSIDFLDFLFSFYERILIPQLVLGAVGYVPQLSNPTPAGRRRAPAAEGMAGAQGLTGQPVFRVRVEVGTAGTVMTAVVGVRELGGGSCEGG